MLKRFFGGVLGVVAVGAGGGGVAGAEEVVVSIKPLHALVQGVLGETQSAVLLHDGARSVHGAALRPSQARLLHGAEVVFFVHEGLEGFLPAAVVEGEVGRRVVDFPDVKVLPAREGGDDHDEHDGYDGHAEEGGHDGHDDHDGYDGHAEGEGHDGHDEHDGHAEEEGHDGHGHGHGGGDWHVWLDVENAKAIVRHLPEVLAVHYPQNAEAYRRNAAAMEQRLDELDAELREMMAPVAGRRFVAHHDAYQYVERRYGLAPAIALQDGHLSPSAKRMGEIRREVREYEVTCVLRETQFSDALVDSVVGWVGEDAKVVAVDPLGGALEVEAGTEAYFALMRDVVGRIGACLAR